MLLTELFTVDKLFDVQFSNIDASVQCGVRRIRIIYDGSSSQNQKFSTFFCVGLMENVITGKPVISTEYLLH